MPSRNTLRTVAALVAAFVGPLLLVGLVSCGGKGSDEGSSTTPPELEVELTEDASLMVLRPEDFGPAHYCEPTTSPELAPGGRVELCIRTPPARAEGDEACVLSSAFLFPQISDAQRFFTDFEQDRRLELAKENGLEISEGQAPELGEQAALYTVTDVSTDICGLAGAPAKAIWISVRQGKAILRVELWALGQTASADEALGLAANQLKRAEMVPTLQPSQMLLRQSDLPAGFAFGGEVPVGLWGRAIAFSNEGEGSAIGSFAAPFRTPGEAQTALAGMQLEGLPAVTFGQTALALSEPRQELEAPPVGEEARALRATSDDGREAYIVAFRRGPGLAAVVSLAGAGRFSEEDVVKLALTQDRRIEDALR